MKFEEIEDPKTSVLPPIRDESATFRATIIWGWHRGPFMKSNSRPLGGGRFTNRGLAQFVDVLLQSRHRPAYGAACRATSPIDC